MVMGKEVPFGGMYGYGMGVNKFLGAGDARVLCFLGDTYVFK